MLQLAASGRYGQALLRDGYCIVPDAVDADAIAAIAAELDAPFANTDFSEGAFSGSDTRRFGGLLTRAPGTAALVDHAGVLGVVDSVLAPWCDHFALNLTQAIELAPGSAAQVPHRDQDMWPCSQLLEPGKEVEFLVNVMWPITPFIRENGATWVWPGSHRRQSELLIDPDEAVVAEMEPGSALLFLGSTLHAAGANQSPLPRRGIIISYCLGWLKPYELPWLTYPPHIARRFPRRLAELAGYRVHRPNLGTVDGQCPSTLLYGAPGRTRAVDMLLPEQDDLIRAWREGEVTASDFAATASAQ